jgi:hypothetical protein
MSDAAGRLSGNDSDRARWYWLLTLLTLLLFTAANSRSFQFSDSAAHYYEGLLVAGGAKPFLDFVENKNPAMYYLSALPALAGGWDMRYGIYFFRAIDILALLSIYRLLPLLTTSRMILALTALAVTLAYSSMFWFGKESIYVEPIEIICFASAYHIYLKGGSFLACGMTIGTGLAFRQTAILDLVVIALHVLVVGGRKSVPRIIQLCFGAALPMLLFLNISMTEGWTELWWKYAYEWNAQYKQFDTPAYFNLPYSFQFCFGKPYLLVFTLSIIFWLALSFSDLIRPVRSFSEMNYHHTDILQTRDSHRDMHLFLMLSLAFHLFEVTASSVIHLHHCLVLLPVYGMTMAYTLARMQTASAGVIHDALPFVHRITIALCLVNCAVFGMRCLRTLSGRWIHLEAHADRIEFLGRMANERSKPDEKILAWGWAPELYLAAERHAASSFVHNLILSNWRESFLPLDPASLRKFQRDMAEHKPKLIFLLSELDIRKYYPEVESLYDLETVKDPLGQDIRIMVRREPGSLPLRRE